MANTLFLYVSGAKAREPFCLFRDRQRLSQVSLRKQEIQIALSAVVEKERNKGELSLTFALRQRKRHCIFPSSERKYRRVGELSLLFSPQTEIEKGIIFLHPFQTERALCLPGDSQRETEREKERQLSLSLSLIIRRERDREQKLFLSREKEREREREKHYLCHCFLSRWI